MRSNLFIPAFNQKYLKKILVTNFDSYIFDLEDSVPSDKKNLARYNIKNFFKKKINKLFFFRINEIRSKYFKADIALLRYISKKLEIKINIVLPKTENENDIKYLISYFKRPCNIFPLIETAKSLINLEKIVSSSKHVKGLMLGTEDMIADFKASKSASSILELARMRSLIVCRAYKKICIDTVVTDLNNLTLFRNFCQISYNQGFDGILCLNIKQAKIAHKEFSVTSKYYKMLKNIIERYQRNTKSVFYYKSNKKSIFLSPPTIKIYENFIEKYEKQRK
jgi:citrate lyase subunit beta/citryl-CoA lyase